MDADITPGVRAPKWATLIGAWIGRARVFAARVKVIFQQAPILATGATGLLAGLSIAQWSQQQIAGNSPLAAKTSAMDRAGIGMDTAAISPMSWLADDAAVEFFDGGRKPFSFSPSGKIDLQPPEIPSLTGDYAARGVSIAQPAPDAVSTVLTNSFEVVTPGGLAAMDGKGLLYVTGAARLRNTDKSNERGIGSTAPDGKTVWRTSVAIDLSKTGQSTRFLSALRWDTTVTAMIPLPNPGRIAVGGADGRIAVIGEDGRPILSTDRTTAQKDMQSHGAPVVALAAAGTWTDQGKAQLASAASDGSIKVWCPLDGGAILTSRDVLFPEGTSLSALAPDSLELSDDGQFLTVRTPAGAIFAARLTGLGGKAAEAKGAVSSDTNILADLQLGYPTTASALSRGSGASLYVARPDCSIQEVDLANVTDNGTLDGFDTRAASVSGKLTLRGHNGPISRLAVSHDNRYLAAASLDGRVRIHHLAPLRYVAMLPFADLPTGPACTSTAALELPPRSDAQPDAQPEPKKGN
jgi:hypothetical protein